MLITSSIGSYTPIPTNAAYSASKAMVSNFALALHYEVKEKIDVVGWEAGGVKTKISYEMRLDKSAEPPSFMLKSTEDACKDVLKQFGRASLTNGSYAFLI